MWVEKNIDIEVLTNIPSARDLDLTSNQNASNPPPLPPSHATESKLQRDEWMLSENPSSSSRLISSDGDLTEEYGEQTGDKRTMAGGIDFFSSLGTEHKKKAPELRELQEAKISSKEINKNIAVQAGSLIDTTPASLETPKRKFVPGGAGSQWRMTKLRRTIEAAEEEGKPVEEMALERYDSLDEFREALEERKLVDEREGRRSSMGGEGRKGKGRPRDSLGETGYMFSDVGSGPPSRSGSFRRPVVGTDSTPSTPSTGRPSLPPFPNRTIENLRSSTSTPPPRAHGRTPIPSVLTPQLPKPSLPKDVLSTSDLNKLQARALRAKLMGGADAEKLQAEYEEALERSHQHESSATRVEVLPTLDSRGRLYDYGVSAPSTSEDASERPGNRRKKPARVETRDPKTGDVVRYNADDDSTTLGDLVRQERFGAGIEDEKNLDAQMARAIAGDGKFEDDLEYMDDNADKLGRRKMRTDAMRRQFAIHDYAKTQKVMATCPHCFKEDDSPPSAAVIAMGTRAYLACTTSQELVDGHAHIVPIQHHLTMLEADDDVWDEVRNFMKCLMKMFAAEDKGVVFYETVLSLKWQRHTVIECVPVPWDEFELLPGYFKESILSSEAEWSTHKKLIDFSARPGGFRRAMVPNLPYFMVQWDYKGEKGYGHVIEGVGDAAGAGEGDGAVDEGDKGGGEFPRWFAAEIIGGVLELEPRRWRRPKKIDFASNKERVRRFRQQYDKYDWTGMIGKE
ncbi:hypothetical protein SISNIDRAFT_430789 [Sistotremastrum niveocremeum HHB9708]|uniref:Cwf19-like C-terminal domain-containing protein n=1 Tax=Sistotremastrum niveocremeum HHB9708 TaxID=1314777 RepID=A0A164RFQ0_9AGAM|nr:hypothetical protein SISNIDRAFT_430789 [Sistotremastrum niveocremeum HHB9708]